MPRLFVAICPPVTVRDALADLMDGIEGARWQSAEQLHLTVRYIGDVEPRVAEDVVSALSAVRADRVAVTLRGAGQFDSRGRPNAVWLGAEPRDALGALHAKVDAALVRAGLPPEGRAYLPHVTVARLGSDAGPVEPWLVANAAVALPRFIADALLLFESTLSRHGSTYEAVARFPLI